ncbi:hypothetical protein [Streptomyces sp. SID10815]|uniref:hypothetical protein n=1 Tax=Streptomyces sp. SID10815 TaxID=2706027 RepID=UPI0013C771E2|nr:hypothetical protein [Streptomyces sp. SID10815]NEA51013.1 hypothetical protein [Streptomyces sp. SID10815]
MGSSKSNSESAIGCGVIVVIAIIWSMVSQCSGGDDKSESAPMAKPSATASATAGSRKPTRQMPEKVTMSLSEIVDTPGTITRFKEFVTEYGTTEQKQAVKQLKKWRGFSQKAYPAIEVTSDYPTVDYEADGATDEVMALEKESQYIAEAFAAWWQIDEPSVIQVFDRGGQYTAGTSCIRTDSAEKEGSCL